MKKLVRIFPPISYVDGMYLQNELLLHIIHIAEGNLGSQRSSLKPGVQFWDPPKPKDKQKQR